ncbi:MAG TPA: DUF1552 domain-containing protein [Myxococcota bacterium]|nr:DUF1552 domain-containing protein [Myxococcota bacterium]
MAPVTRRGLLTTLGVSLIAAPFLRLLGSPTRASASSRPSRLLIFFSPNGTIPHRWRPIASGDPLGFDFAPGSILEPLRDRRHELLVVDGLHFHRADNHEGGMAAMLTNGGGLDSPTSGASLDQVIASRIGASSRFASLELGVQTSLWGGGAQTRMSYSRAGSWLTPDDDPHHAFTRLFGTGAGDAELRRQRRQSVLDLNRRELLGLHRRLGRAEQQKLEAHLESLRSLERGLQPVTTCATPATPNRLAPHDNGLFPDLLAQQTELAALALGCDLTRAVTLQCAHTVAPTVMTWLGVDEQHHSLSHCDDNNVAGVESFVKTERFFAERFGELLSALASRPDPDHPEDTSRTLLDATLVVWAKELGDSRLHVCKDVPFVLAGGGLRTGRWLKTSPDTPHARLLTAICQRFELPLDTFGDVTAGSGALELG